MGFFCHFSLNLILNNPCYELNCVPPKSYVETQNDGISFPKEIIKVKWESKGWDPNLIELMFLKEEKTLEISLSVSTQSKGHVRTQFAGHCREVSAETNPESILILDLPACRAVRKYFCCISCQVYGIL